VTIAPSSETTKRCSRCKISKPLVDFHKSKKSALKTQGYCKDCNKRQARAKNWKKNGIIFSEERYQELMNQQGGRCAICECEQDPNRSFEVDHNHETNEVRGLLCLNCNTGIGKLQDSEVILQAAIDYLKKHREPALSG
jgi:hypothetical protein